MRTAKHLQQQQSQERLLASVARAESPTELHNIAYGIKYALSSGQIQRFHVPKVARAISRRYSSLTGAKIYFCQWCGAECPPPNMYFCQRHARDAAKAYSEELKRGPL